MLMYAYISIECTTEKIQERKIMTIDQYINNAALYTLLMFLMFFIPARTNRYVKIGAFTIAFNCGISLLWLIGLLTGLSPKLVGETTAQTLSLIITLIMWIPSVILILLMLEIGRGKKKE